VLRAHGDDLKLRQVTDSGGAFLIIVVVDIIYVFTPATAAAVRDT